MRTTCASATVPSARICRRPHGQSPFQPPSSRELWPVELDAADHFGAIRSPVVPLRVEGDAGGVDESSVVRSRGLLGPRLHSRCRRRSRRLLDGPVEPGELRDLARAGPDLRPHVGGELRGLRSSEDPRGWRGSPRPRRPGPRRAALAAPRGPGDPRSRPGGEARDPRRGRHERRAPTGGSGRIAPGGPPVRVGQRRPLRVWPGRPGDSLKITGMGLVSFPSPLAGQEDRPRSPFGVARRWGARP